MFLFLFLKYFYPAVITQIFIVVAELTIPAGIPTKEVKSEIEADPVTEEAKINKGSVKFKILQTFLCFLLAYSFCLISSMK